MCDHCGCSTPKPGHHHHDHEHGHDHGPTNFLTKYIFSQDHKIIGIQFLFSTMLWLFVGETGAAVIVVSGVFGEGWRGRKDEAGGT